MLEKRSFSLSGHRTSIALEPEFWHALQKLADARLQNLLGLIAEIDATRTPQQNLASALRIHALNRHDETR